MVERIKTFEDLKCWQSCDELRSFVSSLLKKFPAEEKYLLISQMKRSSRSVTDNIAEGYGRFHYKENRQFCRQSRGSLSELLNQFITSFDEQYISKEEYEKGREMIEKSLTILNGYINYLTNAKSIETNNQ